MSETSGAVLVTGAAGKLGTEVVAQLRAAGRRVVAADRADGGADGLRLDLTDAAAVRAAMRGCDDVVHLGAYPTPMAGPPDVVFANNTQATFHVLLAAADQGVRTAVIASSICAYGMTFARHPFSPAYLPVDEDHPLAPQDWYGLSKQVDEATAGMFARRAGISVVALRFHFVSTADEQRARVAVLDDDPGQGARELWGYVDVRDAARACLLATTVRQPGVHPVVVAAPDTLSRVPTRTLMAEFHPGVDVPDAVPPHGTAWATTRARDLLGFTAEHSWRDHPRENR